jgi:hypothetical protein
LRDFERTYPIVLNVARNLCDAPIMIFSAAASQVNLSLELEGLAAYVGVIRLATASLACASCGAKANADPV